MWVVSFFGDFGAFWMYKIGFIRASEIFAKSFMVAIFMIVMSGLSAGSSFVSAMSSLCSFKIFLRGFSLGFGGIFGLVFMYMTLVIARDVEAIAQNV